jgi:hypothetical protein
MGEEVTLSFGFSEDGMCCVTVEGHEDRPFWMKVPPLTPEAEFVYFFTTAFGAYLEATTDYDITVENMRVPKQSVH